MEYDYHRAEEKRSELKDVAASILREFNSKRSETLAGKIIDHFVRITPPEQAEEHIKFITVWDRVGMWGGESIKPGNILLNIGTFIQALSSGALAFADATTKPRKPWKFVAVALCVWADLLSAAKVHLSEREAAILWTTWLKSDDEHTI